MRTGNVTILLLVVGLTGSVGAKDTADGLAFFEAKIRPVLIQHCYQCHAADARSVKGGLLLDSRESLRAGGDSGPAVVLDDVESSPLLSALRYEDYEMPPKGPLAAEVIEDFRQWIAMGAPDPRDGEQVVRREIDLAEGRQFWAFQPLQHATTPVTESNWPRTDVDHYVVKGYAEQGLTPVADAAPAAWLRRVSFDLLGLPPTQRQLDDFLSDPREDRREHVVESMLASSQFGERWGRYWLDLARYAESTGRTRNYPYPYAWRYRDYVIASLNDDKPIDQFIVEQLAGDLLPHDTDPERIELATATGFLAVGSPDLNERDRLVYQMDTVADQIDTVGRALLGLTIGCARCHDHKFDPIPTDDYYALAGIFKSTETLNGYASRQGGGNRMRGDRLIPLGDAPARELTADEELVEGLSAKDARKLRKSKQGVDDVKARMDRIKRNKSLPRAKRNKQLAAAKKELARANRQFTQLRNRLDRNRAWEPSGPMCMGVRDAKRIENCQVHIRGDARKLGDEVSRGFLQVLGGDAELPSGQSGRLELAQWIVRHDNPLTPRVFVNRVWAQLFGKGLVRTVDNFGAMGASPSHPELLDHLAAEFQKDGWSLKRLLRQLVLSRVYGLEALHDEANAAIDGANRFLWRMPARRLDYESLRDAMLQVSGELVTTPPTGSVVSTLKMNEVTRQKWNAEAVAHHRSVYLPVVRSMLPAEAIAFDMPDPSETRGLRDVTTVPTQSLYMLNSDFVRERAKAVAQKLPEEISPREAARWAYQRLLTRLPTAAEQSRLTDYVTQRRETYELTDRMDPSASWQAAWTDALHAMLASAEFRYR